MQLYYIMLCYIIYKKLYPTPSGPSPVTISLHLYFLKHFEENFPRTTIIMNTLKVCINLSVSTVIN